jgi:hypothetical protein
MHQDRSRCRGPSCNPAVTFQPAQLLWMLPRQPMRDSARGAVAAARKAQTAGRRKWDAPWGTTPPSPRRSSGQMRCRGQGTPHTCQVSQNPAPAQAGGQGHACAWQDAMQHSCSTAPAELQCYNVDSSWPNTLAETPLHCGCRLPAYGPVHVPPPLQQSVHPPGTQQSCLHDTHNSSPCCRLQTIAHSPESITLEPPQCA